MDAELEQALHRQFRDQRVTGEILLVRVADIVTAIEQLAPDAPMDVSNTYPWSDEVIPKASPSSV